MEEINKNYYLRLDENGRLTLELTDTKSLEDCVKLTMECINEMNSVYSSEAPNPTRSVE